MELRKPRMPPILVTGSSGFIGYATARTFADRVDVVGFDREGPPDPPASVECVTVDVTSDESVKRAFQTVREHHGQRLASVIHLAAYYDFSGEPSPNYEKVTIRGTERILRALKDFELEQFVFASTMLVHAPCEPGQKINEASPTEPKWDYPRSKLDTENLIRGQHGNFPVVILRIAGAYDDRCHSIPLAHQIQRIYERKLVSHLYPGHTAHGSAFLHLDDLVRAFELVVKKRSQLSAEFIALLGEEETLSYDELQHILGRLIHDEEWQTTQIPKAVAKTGSWLQDAIPGEEPFIKPWMVDLADDHYELDITRAKETLGWLPKCSLREMLPKMVKALLADPPKWYRENKLEPPSWLEQPSQRLEK